MDNRPRDEPQTSEDFALGSSPSSEAMELVSLDVEDYRRTAQLLAETEGNNTTADSRPHLGNARTNTESSVAYEHFDHTSVDPLLQENTTHTPLLAFSTTDTTVPMTSCTTASPPNLVAVTQAASSALPYRQQAEDPHAPSIEQPLMAWVPLELESAEAFPWLENSTLSEEQEQRLLGSVRDEIRRALAAAFSSNGSPSVAPRRFPVRRRAPSPLRFLKRHWYLLAPLIVSLYVGTSLSFPKNPGDYYSYERPAPVNNMEIPRSILPEAPKRTFGREEDRLRLAKYLKKPGTMAALTGGAGVGKSHLASKFVHDWVAEGSTNMKRFGFWIAAETEGAVRRGYSHILQALGVNIEEENEYFSTSKLARIVWTNLSETSEFEWMVVFDNVPAADSEAGGSGPEVVKEWFFPSPQHSWDTGRILFTTQSHSYQGRTVLGEIRRFELFPLPADDAVPMLLERLETPWATTRRKTRKAAARLVGEEYLKGLPIAIDAAATYMKEHELPLPEYLKRMKDVDPGSRVANSMQLAVDFARDQGHGKILDIMAFVSPYDIPPWLIGDDRDTEDALGKLLTLSILKWDDSDHLSMHRLYQIALQKDGHMDSAIGAMLPFLKAFDKTNKTTWSRPKDLLPHVDQLKGHIESRGLGRKLTILFSDILQWSAIAMEYSTFEYVTAKQYLESALRTKLVVYGREANDDVAAVLNDLGMVLLKLGDLEGARDKVVQSLEMKWALYGQDIKKRSVAVSLDNLGTALKRLGDYKGAKEKYEQALEMLWALNGREAVNTDLASLLNNLGLLLDKMGDYEGAKDKLEQALDMKRAVYGRDANNTFLASTLDNLGMVLQDMEDYEGAKEKYEQALKMLQLVYGGGAKNTNLAIVINDLGTLLKDMRDYEGAKEHYEQSLDMMFAVHGRDAKHTIVATLFNNIGVILKVLGDYDGAKEKYEQALEVYWAVYGRGAKNTDLAMTIGNLGNVLKYTRDYKGAMEKYNQALEMKWAVYGPKAENTDLASSIYSIGTLLQTTGDIEGACQHYKQSARMIESAYGKSSKLLLFAEARLRLTIFCGSSPQLLVGSNKTQT